MINYFAKFILETEPNTDVIVSTSIFQKKIEGHPKSHTHTQSKKFTNFERVVGVLEQKHEQTNSPKVEALLTRGQGSLELRLVDEPTPINVHHLEAPNDVWMGPGGEIGVPM